MVFWYLKYWVWMNSQQLDTLCNSEWENTKQRMEKIRWLRTGVSQKNILDNARGKRGSRYASSFSHSPSDTQIFLNTRRPASKADKFLNTRSALFRSMAMADIFDNIKMSRTMGINGYKYVPSWQNCLS